ncbi:T9SS type A sorting domain-containing protein [Kordia sp.]|uniref:T9SS type A sorting domain-containing protein n=1 Tax=Kordia sp. TaxID=1965332 RepID=UPI003D6BEB87
MYTKRKNVTKFIFILFLCFTTTKVHSQDAQLLRTWYIIEVINDFVSTPYTQPPTITEVGTITFLDTTDAINIIGFSGCNAFQVEASSFNHSENDYGSMILSNFSSETNYCSDAYDNWEGRFYWMLDNFMQYYLHSANGVDYLDLENPLFSGIYLQSQPLSVTENSISNIRIYPNPTTDKLFVSNATVQIKSFVIHNIQGQRIKEIKNTNNIIDVSTLSKGLYFLEMVTPTGKFREKFMKN